MFGVSLTCTVCTGQTPLGWGTKHHHPLHNGPHTAQSSAKHTHWKTRCLQVSPVSETESIILPNLGSWKAHLPLHDIFSYFEKITKRKISNCTLATWKYSSDLGLIFTESLVLLFTKRACFAKYIKQLCSIKPFSKKIKRIERICMKTDNLISVLKRLNWLSCLQCCDKMFIGPKAGISRLQLYQLLISDKFFKYANQVMF